MLFSKGDLSRPLSESEIPMSTLLGLGEVATAAMRRFETHTDGGVGVGVGVGGGSDPDGAADGAGVEVDAAVP